MIQMLKWRLFNNCNFRCSYCCNSVTNKVQNPINFERLKSYAESIHNLLLKEKDDYEVFLIGGEITLLPIEQLKELIRTLYTKNVIKFHITTNMSAKVEYYYSLADLCDKLGVKLKVVGSLHEEMMKYEVFMDKAKKLSKRLDLFTVEFVVTSKNKDIFKKLREECKENNILMFADYNRKEVWNPDEIDTDKNQRNKLRATLSPKGLICSNSKYVINILNDGKVYGVNCHNKKLMGMINMLKEFKREELECHQNVCSFCGKMEVKTKDGEVVYTNVHTNDLINYYVNENLIEEYRRKFEND